MSSSPFSVQSSQLAYFLGSIDLSDRLRTAETIRKRIPSLDGSPTILPIPDNAPAEIPRISLSSRDQQFICNVSLARLDFIYKFPDNKNGINTSKYEEELNKKVGILNEIIFKDINASSYRLGLILNYYSYPKGGGLNFLNEYALGETNSKAVEVQLHKLSLEKIDIMQINNWIRLVANSNKLVDGKNPLLLISDINTIQSEKYQVDANIAVKFYREAFKMSIKTASEMITKEN